MSDKWLDDDGETWLIDPDDILADTNRARLAGCSPELLEALAGMVKASNNCGYECEQVKLMDARKAAESAIAKAAATPAEAP